MRLFGKKKETSKSSGRVSPEEAIRKLNDTAEMLRKRQAFLQHQIEGETDQIKKLLREKKDPNNRKKAQTILKKRKLKEKSVDTLEQQIMNLETQVLTLQDAVVGVDGYKAQRVFTDAMKNIHEGMSIDDVEEQNMDAEEQLQMASEISGALAKPVGGQEFDEDELNEELEQLEQEELDKELTEVSVGDLELDESAMPAAPKGKPSLMPVPAQGECFLTACSYSYKVMHSGNR